MILRPLTHVYYRLITEEVRCKVPIVGTGNCFVAERTRSGIRYAHRRCRHIEFGKAVRHSLRADAVALRSIRSKLQPEHPPVSGPMRNKFQDLVGLRSVMSSCVTKDIFHSNNS